MTPEQREQRLREMYVDGPDRHGTIEYLFELLAAERVRCDDLKRERDEAVAHVSRLWQERDGWKARAELCARCTPERDHNGVLCRGCANARVAVLEKALTEIARFDPEVWTHFSWLLLFRKTQDIALAALAVPGRPGSGGAAEDDTQSLLTSKGMGGLVRGMQEPPPTNPAELEPFESGWWSVRDEPLPEAEMERRPATDGEETCT